MGQVITKGITDNAVTDQKIRLRNAQDFRARNASDTGDISILRVNSANLAELRGTLSAAGFNITLLADPVSAQDAATKNYVDMAIQGLAPKLDCQASTTAALAANTYANGAAGVGATLTANANGALGALDGYTPAVNDRILVKNEAAGANNGIYTVTQVGDASHPYILTRATDADTAVKLKGAYTIVRNGTTLADHFFINTTPDPITIGTTALTFADYGQFSVTAGNGLSKVGIVIATANGSGLEYDGSNNNQVKTQASSSLSVAVKDQTTGIDAGNGNAVKSLRSKKENFTLSSGDITNQYVDLANVAHADSIVVRPDGLLPQRETADYTLNYTGGAGSKTRITFAGDLATGGAAALVAGDVVRVQYRYL